MKATISFRGNATDKHNISGKPLEIVEIVEGRVTLRLPNGKKADFAVKDMTEVHGELKFGATDNEIVGVSDDPETAPTEPQSAPLFEEAVEEAPKPAKPAKSAKAEAVTE